MKNQKTANKKFFDNIANLLHEARKNVVQNVNNTMVRAYYEIGRMIVENEQGGQNRAEYGKQVLIELSFRLTNEFGKGYSVDNLQNMRHFYLVYSKNLEIPENKQVSENKRVVKYETVSRISFPSHFQLSWSHYLKLMRIDDEAERRFYEIESFANNCKSL
ncbi:MAG: DUF1016 N-terminal domain-containing protein [Planctomycetaceae bacterium]|jgi:hypothetical protein|nr:DUF1016 N-terminal domain-containing protein [Planctomycetaceae bacterium]